MRRATIKREIDVALSDPQKDKEYISKLKKTKDKVRYLRIVKGYGQVEAAKLIGISDRHIRRIEKELN
ncbi:hypothetical protein CLPUN_42110 [Clostridium puniceum]|uniref:RNA polymerase sigma-70 region 4 domain-containing protein n=1 Tax=Clostridium puniceum TaxID=29367 RepID=A0A1S8T8A0_9CLOT|nr:RNA polymerase subunit sigma [Clostridium puniceum]OOM73973.1 hypothetical protein CLPUN_42110 [Clostridium puniceum]